ncbi:putative phosphatase [Trypanosoma conorhini]|uniref:Putative phosphatase n=1 Tax=Trypanosoma conorhini TaxID=83891 RepID=A0A422P1J1_9TRYP|nr:putative phosphatase [Trypanosoma conorhini]RNF11590.1 putative phosphatase [Trypanosoma conorhini]
MRDVRIHSFLVCDWFRSLSAPALTVEACNATVEAERVSPFERDPISSEITRITSSSVRHTLGMVLSAFYIISLEVKAYVRSYTFRRLADAFTHAHASVKLRHSPVERELIYAFFLDWAYSIQDLDFNVDRVEETNSQLLKIAKSPSNALEDTSHDDFQQPALTF